MHSSLSEWINKLRSASHPDASAGIMARTERERQRQQAIQQNASLNYAASDSDAQSRFQQWREKDPYPNIPSALLNAADIADYVKQTGMIFPFYPDRLKPASYEVALLGKYLFVDSRGKRQVGEIERGKSFTLKKNSIAFVSVEPFLRLPDYMALRHNLKISNVYKGLLVGTGPLVDPGFVGRLSLPLHNLTNEDYELIGGEGIIWVEFTKLSPVASWRPRTVVSRRGAAYVSFPPQKIELEEVNDYVSKAAGPGRLPSSSIAGVAREARKARNTAKNTRRVLFSFGIIGVLALLYATVQLLLPTIQLQQDTNNSLRDQQRQIEELKRTVDHLQDELNQPSSRKAAP